MNVAEDLRLWFSVGVVLYQDPPVASFSWEPRCYFFDDNHRVDLECLPGLALDEEGSTCGAVLAPNGPAVAICVLPRGHETRHLPVGLQLLDESPFHVTRVSVRRSTGP